MNDLPTEAGGCEGCTCAGCCMGGAASELDEMADGNMSRRDALGRLAGIGLGVATVGLVAGCPTTGQNPAADAPQKYAPIHGAADAPATDPAAGIVPIVRDDDLHSYTEDGLIKLASVGDLTQATPTPYRIGKKLLYAYRGKKPDGTEEFAIYDRRCPHNGCTLQYALVNVPDGERTFEFRCPCHGSRFNTHGERLAGPARKNMTSYYFELRDVGRPDPNPLERAKQRIMCIDLNQVEAPVPASPDKDPAKG